MVVVAMEGSAGVMDGHRSRNSWQKGCVGTLLALLVLGSMGGVAASRDSGPDLTAFARYNEVRIYDRYFRKYSKRFFGVGFDWFFFKSQAVAESNLREEVQSSAGAVGVMQIMPSTFEEIQDRNPSISGPIDQARWNIAAGIWYDRQNFVVWETVRPSGEKLKFMLGSYNAGRSSILRAREVAVEDGLDGRLWESIALGLPEITGRRSSETLVYVERVLGIRKVLR